MPNYNGSGSEQTVICMKGITKNFSRVVANDHIDLEVKAGEIRALLGENGAGKSTLMNILYGLYKPDEGEIFIRGKKVSIRSPKDAINLGVFMVHQHFMLVRSMTVTENIILGLGTSKRLFLDLDGAEKKVLKLSQKYGLKVDPQAKIERLSVGERQRVEILKALYRNAEILILDEPTSVLTPPEIKELITVLKKIASERSAVIIFVTHKLPEVMAISDRVTVLRAGKVIATIETKHTDEEQLAEKMVGRKVLFRLERKPVEKGKVILEVKEVEALNDRGLPALKKVSFAVREGEILGIAGAAGNGQKELREVITGLRCATGGKFVINGHDMTKSCPAEIIKSGVCHIPEDREMSLVMDFSVAENLILEIHHKPPFAYRWFLPFENNWFLDHRKIAEFANGIISDYNIVTPSTNTRSRKLSGGNIQKLITGRELSRNPKLLIVSQPTMGLDVGATEYIRQIMMKQRATGTAILLISEDLDEIIMMSDRIAVMYEGEIVGIVPTEKAKIEDIGLLMAGAKRMIPKNDE